MNPRQYLMENESKSKIKEKVNMNSDKNGMDKFRWKEMFPSDFCRIPNKLLKRVILPYSHKFTKSELILLMYFFCNGMSYNRCYYFYDIEVILDDTGLSLSSFKRAFKNLQEYNIMKLIKVEGKKKDIHKKYGLWNNKLVVTNPFYDTWTILKDEIENDIKIEEETITKDSHLTDEEIIKSLDDL